MTLTIPDDILKAANIDERTMRIEIACHLFDLERLSLFEAGRLAQLDRGDFEDELHDRQIPIYRVEVEDFEQDLRAIEQWKRDSEPGKG